VVWWQLQTFTITITTYQTIMTTSITSKQTNRIAVLSNVVMKSSYNLSITEHRLLKYFISTIKFNDVLDSREAHSITVSEFADYWEIHASDARKMLQVAGNTLFDRYIHQDDGNLGFKKTRWVWKVGFEATTDTFEIAWTEPVIQHISLLRERFVKLDLKELVALDSSYSFRLYEILTTVVGENGYKNPYFTVEQLMYMLDVPDSCKVYKTFKQRVVMIAIKELKTKVKRFEKMEMIEEKEKGKKKVVGIRFSGVGVAGTYRRKTGG